MARAHNCAIFSVRSKQLERTVRGWSLCGIPIGDALWKTCKPIVEIFSEYQRSIAELLDAQAAVSNGLIQFRPPAVGNCAGMVHCVSKGFVVVHQSSPFGPQTSADEETLPIYLVDFDGE